MVNKRHCYSVNGVKNVRLVWWVRELFIIIYTVTSHIGDKIILAVL